MYIVDNRSVDMLKGSMILQNSWKLHTSRKQVRLRLKWQISRSNEDKTFAMKTTLYEVSPVLSWVCRAHLILSGLPNSLCSGHTYLSIYDNCQNKFQYAKHIIVGRLITYITCIRQLQYIHFIFSHSYLSVCLLLVFRHTSQTYMY